MSRSAPRRPLHAGSLVFVLAVALASCSLSRSLEEKSQIDYKSGGEQRTTPLEVPPDLAVPRGGDRYTIPEIPEQPTYSQFEREQQQVQPAGGEVIAGSSLTVAGDTLRIERAGQQRWLHVSLTPEVLWPRIRDFWQQAGFIIDTDSPATGILETDWAENRAKLSDDFVRRTIGRVFDKMYSTGERDRFRTRIERNPDGSSDIYVTHRGMVEVYPDKVEQDSTVWQPRPSDPELEIEFLRRLMVALGADAERAAAATVQESATASSAPQLARSADGSAELRIPDGFERAWRRVGLALDRGGFAVEDRDRSKGVYFVRYIDPESDARRTREGGFFSRLFGGSSKKAKQTEIFQIHVQSADDRSTVVVRTGTGEAVPQADQVTASRMLALIEEQLRQ